MNPDILLTMEDLSLRLSGQDILKKISLTLETGRILALLGPSGGGKTSLLKALAGLYPLASGRVHLKNRDITGLPAHRRNLGLMFQDYALFPHLNVRENISFGLDVRGRRGPALAGRLNRLSRIMGLEGLEKRSIASLSGGQRQRVALARALAPEPPLLMLDEPLSALDPQFRRELIMHLATVLPRETEGAIYVTHDQNEALALADWIAIIDKGLIMAQGPGRELYKNPPTLEAAAFLGYNLFPARLEGRSVWSAPDLKIPAAAIRNWNSFKNMKAGAGPVWLACRPEAAKLNLNGAENGLFSAAFEAVTTVVLNSLEGYKVQLRPLAAFAEEAGGRRINVHCPDSRPIRIGDKVKIFLDPGALLIYPRPDNRLAKG